MKFKPGIIIITALIVILAISCNKQWDEHYGEYPETVNENMWDAMQKDPQISEFVAAIKSFQLDSLFKRDNSFSVFAPTNDAVTGFLNNASFDTTVIRYHIASLFINTSDIHGMRQIQTLTKKFALFENNGGNVKIDGIEVNSESPLYINGKYFVVDQVIEPRPNLYEYFRITNPVLSNYIDTQDTIILDKERSKPLGFDDKGNTVYDTVSIVDNKFEMKYFPVKHEFRNIAATIVFPRSDDYNSALDIVADALGGDYVDHNDIPVEWQEQILIPHLLSQGVFLNRLEPEEFIWKSPKDTLKLLNVLGDSVVINYTPIDKALCSNGYTYNYQNFTIPDSLYQGGTKFEGESLLKPTGLKFTWKDSVFVDSGGNTFTPLQELNGTASNDSIIRVPFPKGYAGKYTVEFKTPALFPRKYVMIVRTHMDIGGIYNFYINGELMRTFDYYDYILYRGVLPSVISGQRYLPEGRFNRFDMFVENLTQYGRAKLKIEYTGPGFVASNGLVIDYIEFKPVN